MNDLFNSEIGRINPTIRVEYKDIKPEDSLIKIDAVKLGSVLTEKCGYPPQALVPIQITNATQGDIALARLNLLPKRVEFNNNRIVQNIRDIYKEMLERIDEIPPKDAGKEEDVFVTLLRSKIAQKLFPAYWPYAMLKRTEVPSFFANPDRVEKYLTAAKEGTLDTSKSLPEQRLRAKKFIAKLIELSLKRSMGAVFAHEFEHSNKSNRKLLKL